MFSRLIGFVHRRPNGGQTSRLDTRLVLDTLPFLIAYLWTTGDAIFRGQIIIKTIGDCVTWSELKKKYWGYSLM